MRWDCQHEKEEKKERGRKRTVFLVYAGNGAVRSGIDAQSRGKNRKCSPPLVFRMNRGKRRKRREEPPPPPRESILE